MKGGIETGTLFACPPSAAQGSQAPDIVIERRVTMTDVSILAENGVVPVVMPRSSDPSGLTTV